MEKKHSVLVVDDDASNLLELASILKTDYKVYAVKSGAAAIEKANESLPDVMLLDVIMPDLSGFEVLDELKKFDKTKDIPVIFITGINESEIAEMAGGETVNYINKPFNEIVVKQMIERVLTSIGG